MLNRSQPTSPSRPIWRTWRRYIPVMPASARVAIAIFMPWRTFHCVLWTKSTVISGCLTWTAMNNVPAATAARPAARVSFVVVISMVSSMSAGVRGCCFGTAPKPTRTPGRRASPDDVTGGVRSSAGVRPQQPVLAGSGDGGPAARDGELGEHVLGVGAQRVGRDEQLSGDLRTAQLGVEQAEHLQLTLAQRVGQRCGAGWAAGRGREHPRGGAFSRGRSRCGAQQLEGRCALVEEDPHVALRLRGEG